MDRYVLVQYKDPKVVTRDGRPGLPPLLWPCGHELHPDYEVIELLNPVSEMPEAAKVEQDEDWGHHSNCPVRHDPHLVCNCPSLYGETYGRGPMEAVDQMSTLKRVWGEISPVEQVWFLAWTCSEEAGAPARLRCPTSRLRPVKEAAAPDPLGDPFSHETAVDLVERFRDKDGDSLTERARTRDAIFKVTQLLNRGDTREALESLTALYESLPEE